MFVIKYTDEAIKQLKKMKKTGLNDKLKKIKFTIDKLSINTRYSGLYTHKNETFKILNNIEIFQSYVENKTPAAYRVFWHYGPNKDDITIISITQHP